MPIVIYGEARSVASIVAIEFLGMFTSRVRCISTIIELTSLSLGTKSYTVPTGNPLILTILDLSNVPISGKTANKLGVWLNKLLPFRKLKPIIKIMMDTTASIPTLTSLEIFME
jgi:hypothetical protein